LIHDGVPRERVYASDIFAEYESVGHTMFRDEERLKGNFIEGDILDSSPESALAKTWGTWDAVNICMFLHLFSYDELKLACRNILRLLKPQKGSMIIGAQTASITPADFELKAPILREGIVERA